jgi:drug/metabolite transporter (DMT)-like permease
MIRNFRLAGYALAGFVVLVWGSTFVSTKSLLNDFSPFEILVARFVMGYLCLWLLYPHRLKLAHKKEELLFLGAGIAGVTLYQLMENTALSFTQASNVSIIVSSAPLFTALMVHLFPNAGAGHSKITVSFLLGFVVALFGITLVSFNGAFVLHLNPRGDILALLSAISWGVYSMIMGKINALGYPSLAATRRMFFYAIVCMFPLLLVAGVQTDFMVNAARFLNPVNLFNLCFLGVFASALCFSGWNKASKTLGVIETSVFIYLIPVITMVTAALFIGERVSPLSVAGMFLTTAGLVVSERGIRKNHGQ